MTTDTPQAEERAAAKRLRDLDRARRIRRERAAQARRQRPKRLAQVEARMDALAGEYRTATDPDARRRIRHELADLGRERMTLKWTA